MSSRVLGELAGEAGSPTDFIDGDDEPELAQLRNLTRAGNAAVGVAAYDRNMFHADNGEDLETVLSDFLGDLHHLCDALNLDFDTLRTHGQAHYLAERSGEL